MPTLPTLAAPPPVANRFSIVWGPIDLGAYVEARKCGDARVAILIAGYAATKPTVKFNPLFGEWLETDFLRPPFVLRCGVTHLTAPGAGQQGSVSRAAHPVHLRSRPRQEP